MSPTTDAAALPASQALMPGPHWSPLQSLAVAAGNPTWLNTWTRDAETGQLVCGAPQLVNPNGIRLWRDGRTCPFEAAGTYRRVGAQVTVLNESVFCEKAAGVPWNISEHAYAPFFERVAQTVRAHQPAWLLFAELDPFGAFAGRAFPSDMPAGSINASHWYDIGLLLSKSFDVTSSLDPVTGLAARGPAEIRARYVQQLARLQSLGDHFTATGAPMLVGEFGIPYDLNASAAYRAWANGARGDACWAVHGMALRLMYDAIDHLQLNSTQWNYSAGNRNDPRTGDQWNQEDLSIYSLDQHDEPNDPDSGGRAVAGFCRPYAPVIQGRLTRVHWDADNALFSLDYEADAALVAPSLVYLPQRQFVKGTQLFLAGAAVRWDWLSDQVLCVWALASGSVHLEATHA